MGTVGPRRVGLAEPATVAMKCRRWRRHCGWRTSCSWRACRRETASPGLRSDERGDAGTVMAGTAAAAAEADVSAAAPSSLPSPPPSSYTEADYATTAAAGAAAAGAAAAGAAAALPLPPPQADRRGPSQRANLGPCWGVRRFISPFSWKARSRNCDKPSPSLPIFGCFTTRGAPLSLRRFRAGFGGGGGVVGLRHHHARATGATKKMQRQKGRLDGVGSRLENVLPRVLQILLEVETQLYSEYCWSILPRAVKPSQAAMFPPQALK